MSATTSRHGGRIVMEKPTPLQKAEALKARDLEMYRKMVEGMTAREVGIMFGRTESLVCRRTKALPAFLKKEVRDDVKLVRRARLSRKAEQVEAGVYG